MSSYQYVCESHIHAHNIHTQGEKERTDFANKINEKKVKM